MLEIVICDDIASHNRFVKSSVETAINKYNLPGKIAMVTESADDVLTFAQKPGELRLYLLDINMGNEKDGLMLADKIRESDVSAYIIYITAHAEYSVMGYKTKTFDFLIKPLNKRMIQEAVLRVFEDVEYISKQGRVFQFKVGSVIHYIPVSEILCMQKERNILHVQTENVRLTGYGSLRDAIAHLPKSFALCNKSCLVSLEKVKKMDGANMMLYLKNGQSFQVSRHYKAALAEAMEAYYGG